MEEYLRVGVISSTHGIRGEVKVYPTTDDNKRFKKLKNVILDYKGQYIDLEVSSVKFFKDMVILAFTDYDDINKIEKYKGCDLLVTRDNAVPLKENEYYICDLVGCNVYTENDDEIGILEDVITTGANDVYVVKTPEGKEILLPVIKECILDVNIEDKKVIAHIMKGLLDL